MKNLLKLAALVCLLLCPAIARGEWDFEEEGDHLWLRTDVNDDLTETHVSLFRDGNRVRFEIREFMGCLVSSEEDFRERVDPGVTIISIYGADSVDSVYVDPAVTAMVSVTVRGGDGNDSIDGGTYVMGDGGDDVLVNAISLLGFAGDDLLIAGPLTDRLVGGSGDDRLDASAAEKPCTLRGLDDDDVIIGSRFADVIEGGPGNDKIWGGDGDDTIRGGAPDYEGPDRDVIFGEKGNDEIRGDWDNDLILGGDDDDVIKGGEGSDFLVGDKGNDVLEAGGTTVEGDFLLGLSGADVFIAIGWPDGYFTDYSHRAGDYWLDLRPRRR